MNARLLCWSFLFHLALAALLCGQDAKPAYLGLTRRGEPILVQLAPEAQNLNHRAARLVIIGGHDGDPASTAIVEQLRHDLLQAEATARSKSQVTFIPNVYPAGLAKGVADEDATRGYPPEKGYYDDPLRPESRYLWRWLSQYGADLVIDVRTGKEAGYWLSKGIGTSDWLDLILARDWKKLPKPADDDFAVQLATKGVAESGYSPTLILQIPLAAKETVFKKVNLLLQLARTLDESPARRELMRREEVKAHDIAVMMSENFREELFQLPPLPYNKISVSAYQPGVLGPWYEGWIEDAREAYDRGWEPRKLDEALKMYHAFPRHERKDLTPEQIRELYFMTLAERSARRSTETWATLKSLVVDPVDHSFDSCEAIFSGATLLARTGRWNGRPQYTSAAVELYRNVRKSCRRDDGLYRHTPQADVAWGAGNGLAAMGLALLLNDLPADHPAAEELQKDLQQHVAALLKHQDEWGAWRQVIDKPGSYGEFSATGLIAWTIIRGLDRRWLDPEACGPALARAWLAIKRHISFDGKVSDISRDTNGPALSGHDARGGAIAILLATELMVTDYRPKRSP